VTRRHFPGSSPSLGGTQRSAPTSKRSFWIDRRSAASGQSGQCAATSPTTALSSSTWPYASTRGESLGTRVPSPRPVSPGSPDFVQMRERKTIGLSPWSLVLGHWSFSLTERDGSSRPHEDQQPRTNR